ncbi:MAG: uracil-DNA glycosylase, partial [Microvirga sp.]
MTTSRSEAARSSRQPLSLVPDRDCPLCPRLVAFREANRA